MNQGCLVPTVQTRCLRWFLCRRNRRPQAEYPLCLLSLLRVHQIRSARVRWLQETFTSPVLEGALVLTFNSLKREQSRGNTSVSAVVPFSLQTNNHFYTSMIRSCSRGFFFCLVYLALSRRRRRLPLSHVNSCFTLLPCRCEVITCPIRTERM